MIREPISGVAAMLATLLLTTVVGATLASQGMGRGRGTIPPVPRSRPIFLASK